MNQDIIDKLAQLEIKIQNLMQENFEYKQKIANFEILLKEKTVQLDNLKQENENLQQEIERFQLGKAFAGKTEDNAVAKQKIDGLIKEINLCIAALKE